MVDIISKDNICGGVIAMDAKNNVYPIRSQFVVLACGGIGGLFQNSTNYPHIAGDGLGIAMKHQVKLEHLDYIQIHPTTLFSHKPGRRFLISESVRGEGALLYDKNGQRFTNELQPRDLLSQAIFEQMEKDGTDFVWEDMRPLGEKTIMQHFPNIYQHCIEEGFDPRKEPIPVAVKELFALVNKNEIKPKELILGNGEVCNGDYTLEIKGSGISSQTRISLYGNKADEYFLDYTNANYQNYNGILYIVETLDPERPYVWACAFLLAMSFVFSLIICMNEREKEHE